MPVIAALEERVGGREHARTAGRRRLGGLQHEHHGGLGSGSTLTSACRTDPVGESDGRVRRTGDCKVRAPVGNRSHGGLDRLGAGRRTGTEGHPRTAKPERDGHVGVAHIGQGLDGRQRVHLPQAVLRQPAEVDGCSVR